MNINKDWLEDSSLENGKYLNQCLICRELFTGHKRRTHCKECYNMNPQTLPEYIKPGAFVKLRDGSKARIYATDGADPWTVHGAVLKESNWIAIDWAGVEFKPAEKADYDIIGPWTDKLNCDKLWPLLPPWIKYLAMDANNEWYSYSLKPYAGLSSNWFHNSLECSVCYVPKDYAPIYSGDWKDSLVERPQ